MARIPEVDSLEARKRALLAESEVYRQTLRLELHNLRLYGERTQLRFQRWTAGPLLTLVPLGLVLLRLRFGGGAWRKPRPRWRRWLGGALMGWRLYRQYGPVLNGFLAARFGRSGSAAMRVE